ncbi:hypothetical protein KXS07_25425 [Inquilinus limosus]|uniref:hypothetical protein n=1 Tax=Inquilinus limosus TaxID=171674 RepID=UPI003F1452E7
MGAFKTLAFLAGFGAADPSVIEPVDLTQVDAVVVTGGGLAVAATTDAGRPLTAVLEQSEGCAATLRVEGRVLTVDVREQSSVWPRECRPTLSVNLRPGADIALRPAAVSATLDGRFGAVAVRAQAAELTLTGRASTLDLSARALQATVRSTGPDPGRSIRIQADAADLDLGFRRGTPVSYQVDAKVSVVDSTLPASAGDRPLVSIKGDFVRARIGYVD